jgi:ketosteroid isomerase-like protein
MGIEQNKRIAVELVQALARADKQKVLSLYADDFELWTAGSLPFSGSHTREEAAALMDGILGAFPDGLDFELRAITAEGERVALEAESVGRHASGLEYRNQYHFLLVIRDGKVHQLKEYLDTERAREVLVDGAAPPAR